MTAWLRLFVWETRRLRRSRVALGALGALLVAGACAALAGHATIARQRGEIAGLAAQHRTALDRLASHHPDGDHAGSLAYYAFFPTHRPPGSLAPLTVGVRDATPTAVWVRLLGLEAQLYESDLGSPVARALGSFDLAFVVCALAPFVLLVLTHDLLSRDRDAGTLPLLVTQAGSLVRLITARLAVRAGAVLAVVTAVWAGALAGGRIALDAAALGWWLDAAAYLAVWTAGAGALAVWCRGVAASLAAALAVWVAQAVVLPAAINLVVVAAHPAPEGLELTVRQRQAVHGAWDRPRAETLAEFVAHRPEWAGTPPVTGRFAWKWYYAMHEVGDRRVAGEAAAFRERLRARAAWTDRLAWFAPAVAAQRRFARRADTDLESYLRDLAAIRAFHEELKGFFYPRIFAEATLRPAEFAALPRFAPATAPAATPGGARELPAWAASSFALALLARAGLRRAQRLTA